jgi:glycosyltransferase involved in cell wall biosynthesis
MRLSAVVLTYNEELHIERCINSIRAVCDKILVVDSYSNDRTVEIAEALGAEVVLHHYRSYGEQFNFGIDTLNTNEGWVLRVDADEVLLPDSTKVLRQWLAQQPDDVAGAMLRRRMYFLGHCIKWGGMDPIWQLRLFRAGSGRCEQRIQDPHLLVAGRVVRSDLRLDDINLRPLDWWISKHSWYASREAIVLLDRKYNFLPREARTISGQRGWQADCKRFLKEHAYLSMPGPLRSTLYFLYRYIVMLGMLDGVHGFYFHLMQGFWYRSLVDAKILEVERLLKQRNVSVPEAIEICTGISAGSGSSVSKNRL